MTYFLHKQCHDYYVVYAQGISVLNIHDLYKFKIVRMYPSPMKDLTRGIITLQRKWKNWKKFIRWCSHPVRLHYREVYGKFPPYLNK
jgi:hypothetical protein